MDVEWHRDKAVSNLVKHGVTFEEASTALLDPMALAQEDVAAADEARWVLVGMSDRGRLITVVYTLRNEEETIRLISARKATRREARYYA